MKRFARVLSYKKTPAQLKKQPPEVFCKKRCYWKLRKIHRETPGPEYKVAFLSLELYKKRDDGTGVFLSILRNF